MGEGGGGVDRETGWGKERMVEKPFWEREERLFDVPVCPASSVFFYLSLCMSMSPVLGMTCCQPQCQYLILVVA